jgi:uncharacterized protein (TIGR02452 family)
MDLTTPSYDRVYVWTRTQEYYKDTPMKSSRVFTSLEEVGTPTPRYDSTQIMFANDDCIDVAIRYKREGHNVLLLNMADWKIAGGLVAMGAGTQEEECFRRSDYYKHLHQSYYPLKELDTIVSTQVEYGFHGQKKGYVNMECPETLHMIASPAPRYPELTEDEMFFKNPKDVELLENKIKMLLFAGQTTDADTLVLSAWGCGAFRCPVHHVAQIFRKVLTQHAGLYETIVFAIHGHNFHWFKDSFEH